MPLGLVLHQCLPSESAPIIEAQCYIDITTPVTSDRRYICHRPSCNCKEMEVHSLCDQPPSALPLCAQGEASSFCRLMRWPALWPTMLAGCWAWTLPGCCLSLPGLDWKPSWPTLRRGAAFLVRKTTIAVALGPSRHSGPSHSDAIPNLLKHYSSSMTSRKL